MLWNCIRAGYDARTLRDLLKSAITLKADRTNPFIPLAAVMSQTTGNRLSSYDHTFSCKHSTGWKERSVHPTRNFVREEKAFSAKAEEDSAKSDQLAMAKESGRRLGIRTNIYPSSSFLGHHKDASIRLLYVAKSDRLLIHHNGTERVGSRSGELRETVLETETTEAEPASKPQKKWKRKKRFCSKTEPVLEESEETELASQRKKEFNIQMERDALFRKQHNIHTSGTNIPSPLQDFSELRSRYGKIARTTIAAKDNCNTLRGSWCGSFLLLGMLLVENEYEPGDKEFRGAGHSWHYCGYKPGSCASKITLWDLTLLLCSNGLSRQESDIVSQALAIGFTDERQCNNVGENMFSRFVMLLLPKLHGDGNGDGWDLTLLLCSNGLSRQESDIVSQALAIGFTDERQCNNVVSSGVVHSRGSTATSFNYWTNKIIKREVLDNVSNRVLECVHESSQSHSRWKQVIGTTPSIQSQELRKSVSIAYASRSLQKICIVAFGCERQHGHSEQLDAGIRFLRYRDPRAQRRHPLVDYVCVLEIKRCLNEGIDFQVELFNFRKDGTVLHRKYYATTVASACICLHVTSIPDNLHVLLIVL
ncbi:hypothetical protein Tco_0394537 [Tanacetum coccineum]